MQMAGTIAITADGSGHMYSGSQSRFLFSHFGDVHVGTIARCVGNPGAAENWQWSCGFYPGSDPGEHRVGTTSPVGLKLTSATNGPMSGREGRADVASAGADVCK
jgi:hypothetical protein